MLYSDPFLGFLDRTAIGIEASDFVSVREKLAAGAKSGRYGYIFRTLIALCDVLALKATLGLRTREIYRNGNGEELAQLIEDYRELERRIDTLYKYFRAQWDKECRENGFEYHDIRFGGLTRRIRHCREMLSEYAAGKRKAIPALDEDILPFENRKDGESALYNDWMYTAIIKPKF